jgi:hypothetical protein
VRSASNLATFQIERVSISEAVRISGLKMRTLQNLAAQGVIPGAAKPAGRWTFDISQLRRWVRETPEKALPCRKISTFATASTGVVSRLPDANTENLYMSVLNQRNAPKQRQSSR